VITVPDMPDDWQQGTVLANTAGQRPDYGLDAPPVIYGYAVAAAAGIVLIIIGAVLGVSPLWGVGIYLLVLALVVAGPMVYSSKRGKIHARDRLLTSLGLRGDEDVLDLGCGSGLMLLGAAGRLTSGSATGIDLWRSQDQAGSSREQCQDNAARLGLSDRVELCDGDMTALPFPDASFDLVLACLAIHNLHPNARRQQAIREAARVLRPGGRLALIDIVSTQTYATTATAAGLADVRRSHYIRGIFPPARTVTATHPN
jgi:ubiquinone/menaquinone biosynthesis C-methylase UbiE